MSALRRLAAAAGVCGVVSSFGVAAANETGVPDLGASTGTLPLETAPPPGAFPGDAAAEVDATIAAFADPWLRFFLAYDPAPALSDVDVPVLALFGDLDVQVAADVKGPAAEAALVNKPDASVVTINGLNHLFQPAITGAVSEYQTLGQPFPSETVVLIADWIRTYTEVSGSVSNSTNAAGTCGP